VTGMFDAPIRKKDTFVSRMKTIRGKPVRIHCTKCRFIGIHRLEGDQGYVLKLILPRESIAYETITEWDSNALQTTIANFAKWFPNSELNEEQLQSYFRRSIQPPMFLTVLVSSIKEPIDVRYKTENVTMTQLQQMDRQHLKELMCTVEIESQGLYFHPKKYGIRWLVRKLVLLQSDNISDIEDVEPTNRTEIEMEWVNDARDACTSMENQIQMYYEKIHKLERNIREIQENLEIAKKQPQMDKIWNEALETVRLAIFQRHPQ
jgi:hypothetical protein